MVTLLDVVPEPADGWGDDAACHPSNSPIGLRGWINQFFPSNAETPYKPFCDVCPVRPDCLAWALRQRENHGAWGGCGERERERLGRRLCRGTLDWATLASGLLWPDWEPRRGAPVESTA